MGNMHHQPTVIDLFAGAGGLSCSLEAVGWRSLAAVDNDRSAIETLRANQAKGHLVGTRLVHADVRDVSACDLNPQGSNLDLLAGGPPCQPFSSAGSMKGLQDPRGQLFMEFVRLAGELNPRFVLFENVAGLVTAKDGSGQAGGVLRQVQREFERIGYACRFDLLNAADYGSAQRRVRLYMLAARTGVVPTFPEPTHSRNHSPGLRRWVSLAELLETLPSPMEREIVKPSERRLPELLALAPGSGLRSGGIVEANRPSGHWGYRQDCFVADLTLPSRTIRAASTPDWVRYGNELRRLTWKECAALQGFPSDWEFTGTLSARFRQIGNAVQGHIGRALAERLFREATTPPYGDPQSAEWPASFNRRVKYTNAEEKTNGAHRRAAREGKLNASTSSLV